MKTECKKIELIPKTNYAAAKHIKKLPASCRQIIMTEFATQQKQNHNIQLLIIFKFFTHVKKGKESLHIVLL